MDALKTALKIVIQKSAEETGDLFGNKIEDIITESAPETALRKTKDGKFVAKNQ